MNQNYKSLINEKKWLFEYKLNPMNTINEIQTHFSLKIIINCINEGFKAYPESTDKYIYKFSYELKVWNELWVMMSGVVPNEMHSN